MYEFDVGVWISGCVSGVGLAVITWTMFYLIIDGIQERREGRVRS